MHWIGCDAMWGQFRAIAWAQARSLRNRLPRTTFGAVLMAVFGVLWYGMFAAFGVGAWYIVGALSLHDLRELLSPALFGAFLFWQWMPLLTMSGGWSLQLNKLQSYPISASTFFWIETLLRLTAAPEMVLLVLGAAIGLMDNHNVPLWGAFVLLLYVPFNLFLTLAIRETLMVSFRRSRFRELAAVLFVALMILPQTLLRTSLNERVKPIWEFLVRARGTPWHEFATMAGGQMRGRSVLWIAFWTAFAFCAGRVQFGRALGSEESLRANATPVRDGRRGEGFAGTFARRISGLFRDPIAAVLEKEIRTLLRMPRFRVVFGMACVFSIVLFFPIAFGKGSTGWIRSNFLAVVNLYGLLLLGDTLIWNVFGFERGAAQIWFVMGLDMRSVLMAKNIAAVLFIGLQNAIVLGIATLLQFPVTRFNVECAVLGSAVVSLYFLSIGNLSSVMVPRAVDPSQTLRKQAGAQLQLWLLGSAAAMMVLVGFAFLARWAFATDWALAGVFGIEFAIGLLVYRFAMESAVGRAARNRERILDVLQRNTSPVSV